MTGKLEGLISRPVLMFSPVILGWEDRPPGPGGTSFRPQADTRGFPGQQGTGKNSGPAWTTLLIGAGLLHSGPQLPISRPGSGVKELTSRPALGSKAPPRRD